MESIRVENLSFTYPGRENKVLDNINFTVEQGEFVTVCGKSGCGKTTLLRLLKTSLAPYGETEGSIYFKEKQLSEWSAKEQVAGIGFVMQNPDNQIVTDKVWHELAFGLESLGFSTPEIRARVSEMASFFGIQNWFYKKVTELSGGQKQLLNLASVMVMQPAVLILDEPTSQLDPIAAQEFLKTLEKINRELGTTVILTEHRLEDAFPISHRVIVMDKGKIITMGKPEEVGQVLKKENHHMYRALPAPMRIYSAVEKGTQCPLTVRDGRIWLEEYSRTNELREEIISEPSPSAADTVIEIKDAYFRYEKGLPDVIKGMNIEVGRGELFAVLGGNGTGKTTLLSLISGLNKLYRGEILINGERVSKIKNLYNGLLGVLPQNPQSLFVKKTVYLDLMDVLSERDISKDEKEERIRAMSVLCRIENLLESHPYDLSGGEQQRAALAKVLLQNPQILLLDEATKGMDAHFKQEFAEILSDLKEKGVTVIMVSHDIEFCAEYADRCALVFDGAIISSGSPREFFAGKSFYTTSANRMARTKLPRAVTANDVILACGGSVCKNNENTPTSIKKNDVPPVVEKEEDKKPIRRKTNISAIFAFLFILLAIPLTIYLGIRFLGSRKYYFISLLVMLETVIPFCMVFEKRKPKAREIVTISALCAIAVAGRGAFFMLPQFKPVVALVIIAGVCFGGETGFLVGAVTGFVSNFFFGQGPWTPWQMFAFGLIGFFAGMLFRKATGAKAKLPLCIFGFLATLLIYGGIMNSYHIIQSQANINLKMLSAVYISGLPFDLVHGASTVFFLWFISPVMIEKLERIKIKFGLFKNTY